LCVEWFLTEAQLNSNAFENHLENSEFRKAKVMEFASLLLQATGLPSSVSLLPVLHRGPISATGPTSRPIPSIRRVSPFTCAADAWDLLPSDKNGGAHPHPDAAAQHAAAHAQASRR
jgi:hypothetical protein